MRDIKKQRQWIKDHYDQVTGFRPICIFGAWTDKMILRTMSPEDFLFDGSTNKPFKIYGSINRVHVPRSLLKRARVSVDKVTREIKGRNAMHYANK